MDANNGQIDERGNMKAKLCPLCGGDPIFVEYAVPQGKEPDLWEETETGFEPVFLMKQIECKDCGARNCLVSISCDEVVKNWNEGHVIQLVCREPAPMEEN